MQLMRLDLWHRTVFGVQSVTTAVVCAFTMAAAPGAEAGTFNVFSDHNGSCSIADTQAGSISVYVYHRSPPFDLGVTGSAFRIGSGGGFTGVLMSAVFDPTFWVVGDISQGVAVSYGGCSNDEFILVAIATYSVSGSSTACSYVEVLPFSDGGSVETYNCDMAMEPATATTRLIVNYESSCGPLTCVLSTQSTTWGSIKALYR
jgi:hypothetical protein